ncbi:pirin family protein [Microcoleus sp. herbarium2]|uniref:pirin family protein n=1 Tax=Microcoleus sp. herbarium2 TaxID=3055433 RepID=UPI004040AD30
MPLWGTKGSPQWHSGIATLTFMTQGNFRYVDTTGQQGVLAAGGVEWIKAGNGVWHSAPPLATRRLKASSSGSPCPLRKKTRLRIASTWLRPTCRRKGLRGHYGEAKSPINALAQMTYLSVSIRRSQCLNFC